MNPYIVKPPPEGAGFDTSLTDGLRIAIRDVIGEASAPDERPLDMAGLARSLWPDGFAEHWQFVQGPENHDIVYVDREERIARLGDPGNPRSWYGRSRARVAAGDQPDRAGHSRCSSWARSFSKTSSGRTTSSSIPDLLLHWAGLDAADKQMLDHLRFMRELIHLRWRHPGLRGQGFRVVHANDLNSRACLSALGRRRRATTSSSSCTCRRSTDSTTASDFPAAASGGRSSTATSTSSWVNPNVAGNGGRVSADAAPLHGFGHSAALTLPANSVLVFAR